MNTLNGITIGFFFYGYKRRIIWIPGMGHGWFVFGLRDLGYLSLCMFIHCASDFEKMLHDSHIMGNRDTSPGWGTLKGQRIP